MKERFKLKPFDLFMILGVTACNIIYYIICGKIDWLGFAGAVTGIVNVVLCARGHLLNYAFGVANIMVMTTVYYLNHIWGNAILYGAYFLPMNIIGWISWKKKLNEDGSGVIETKRLSTRKRILWGFLSVGMIIGGMYLLRIFNGNEPMLDSASTVTSVIAMFLLVNAFIEQWFLWMIIDGIYVILWTINVIDGSPHAVSTLVMYAFYFINAIYGMIMWKKLNKKKIKL